MKERTVAPWNQHIVYLCYLFWYHINPPSNRCSSRDFLCCLPWRLNGCRGGRTPVHCAPSPANVRTHSPPSRSAFQTVPGHPEADEAGFCVDIACLRQISPRRAAAAGAAGGRVFYRDKKAGGQLLQSRVQYHHATSPMWCLVGQVDDMLIPRSNRDLFHKLLSAPERVSGTDRGSPPHLFKRSKDTYQN